MDTKDVLARYLRAARASLLWKVEGLSERDARLPRTPTGTNLLGLLKHCLIVEHGYLVECVGRPAVPGLPEVDFEADPNGDFVAAPGETLGHLTALHRRVGEAVGASVAALELDAPASVPWWGERSDTTFGVLLVHTLADVAQHAGHADILREGFDGRAGLREGNSNLWEPTDGWDAHRSRLQAAAEGFPA